MTDIGGYLSAKGAAAYWRGAEKDLYDFAWVLVNAARMDADRAVNAVTAVLDAGVDRDRFGAVLGACASFETAASIGAVVFASASIAAGDQRDHDALALDAVLAVRMFRAGLLRAAEGRDG